MPSDTARRAVDILPWSQGPPEACRRWGSRVYRQRRATESWSMNAG